MHEGHANSHVGMVLQAPLVYYAAQHQCDLNIYLPNQTCTVFVLSNTALGSNKAQGAGGAIYTTSPTGFYTNCAADSNNSAQAGVLPACYVCVSFASCLAATQQMFTVMLAVPALLDTVGKGSGHKDWA